MRSSEAPIGGMESQPVQDSVQCHYEYLQMYYGYFWGPDQQSPLTKFWFLVFRAIVKTAVGTMGAFTIQIILYLPIWVSLSSEALQVLSISRGFFSPTTVVAAVIHYNYGCSGKDTRCLCA